MRDGIGSMSRRAADGRAGGGRGGSRHSWPVLWSEQQQPPQQQQLQRQEHQQQQGRWANLPPELLLDVIQRVEASEATWPARRQVVACAAVCRSWREVTKEVVKTLEECGRITFPISLKQVKASPSLHAGDSLDFSMVNFVDCCSRGLVSIQCSAL